MAIRQSTILSRANFRLSARTLNEAVAQSNPTAFLSHSHKDAALAQGVQGFLNEQGWDVYIDWQDASMPDVPSAETAAKIKSRIRSTDMFILLATQNSSVSKWCPWEVGYADGVKKISSIMILQTEDSAGRTYGAEYLRLYRRIEYTKGGGIGVFDHLDDGFRLKGNSKL